MKSSESLSKIAPALVKAQAHFRGVAKSGQNTWDRYAYANLEDYVRAVRPILAEHGLAVLSSVEEAQTLEERTTQKGGKEYGVRVKLCIRIIHDSGEWIEAESWGEGQDRADKAIYKAITGARKYAMASALGLATTDDPEADEQVGTTAGNQPDELEDNGRWKAAVDEAFQARKFQPSEADAAITTILAAYGVETLEALALDKRYQMLGAIQEGRADKYKATKKVGKQTANAA